MKKEYQKELDKIEQTILIKEEEKEKYKQDQTQEIEILNQVKELINLNEVTKEVIIEFVDKIIVYENKKINVVFNFQDTMKKIEYIIAS